MAYGGVEVYLHSGLTSAPNGNAWSALGPGRFNPVQEQQYPLYRSLGGHKGRSGSFKEGRSVSPMAGNRNTSIQHNSHCTDLANRNTLCWQTSGVKRYNTAANNRSHIRVKLTGAWWRTEQEAGIYVVNIPLRHSTGWSVEADRFLSFQLTHTHTHEWRQSYSQQCEENRSKCESTLLSSATW